MSQQSSSKNTLIVVGVVVVVLLIVLFMQGKDEAIAPASTPSTLDASSESDQSTDAPSDTPVVPETSTGTPAPTPPVQRQPVDIDDTLQDLDAAFEEGDYDTSAVTELFDDTSAEGITQP